MRACRRPRAICAIALAMCIFLSFAAVRGKAFAAYAGSSIGTIYRVGANPSFGIYETDDGFAGIGCDYLNTLSKFTGDSYTYVAGTPEELFTMLHNGEIDMIPCVTEDDCAYFCELVCGGGDDMKTAGSSLLMLFSAVYVYDKGEYKDLALNDVQAIRRMKIGYLEEDAYSYFDGGQFIYSEITGAELVSYNKEATMRDDLASGKIDAVIKSCLRPWKDETIVYQFPVSAGYFAVRSNNTVLSEKLRNGLNSLFLEKPMFYGDVYERHISNFGTQKFAFTAAEREYLSEHSEISLGFNLQSDLMECYDSKTTRLSGIVGALIGKYSEKTGLNIKVKAYSTLQDCLAALSANEVDIVYGGVSVADMSSRSDYYITAPAIYAPLVLSGKGGTEIHDLMKIAVCGNDKEAVNAVERFYPNASVTLTDSVSDAYSLVMDGTCSAVCLVSYDSIYLKGRNNGGLTILETLPIHSTSSFALRVEDKALAGITENVNLQISGSTLLSDIYNIIEMGKFAPPLKGINLVFVILLFVGLAVICALVITLILLENKRRAEVDPLTGGHTKQSFIDSSAKMIKKNSSQHYALMVFDIDKFKYINDRLGYAEGNRMLVRMYKTLSDSMESGEICARLSDDIFACCIRDASETEIRGRVRAIAEEFDRRNSLFVSFPVYFSAGICRLDQCRDNDGLVNFNAAIDRCNIAKNSVKGRSETYAAFYDGKIRERALREKDFENIMPAALERHEFICYVQPKYGTKSRRIEGAEALIRWKNADFGFIFPDEFIPIAEKNGFVVELDFFILEEVCKAMRRWIDKGLTPVVISVNQSRMHLSHDDYIWRLREIVDKYSIPYKYIELEITETVFTDNADLLLHIMQKLHEIGFKLSIDDFGSGYSSLNMLKDIPADVVKIDREFFNGTVDTEKGKAVISTVVDLASKLDMSVTAEGVETLTQVEFLDDINCELIQGYYFSKPVPIEDFEKMWFKELDSLGIDPKNAAK